MKALKPLVSKATIFIFILVGTSARSQVPEQQLRFADSIENLVNISLKKYVVKKDTGRAVNTGSKTRTAFFFKKEFYTDPKNNTLFLVAYFRRFDDGLLINETYYYTQNKPISAYRLRQFKRKIMPEEAFYFYNDKTYRHNDSTILQPNNEIKNKAESFLSEFRKLK
jgi:hypothetical protein